MDGDVNGRIKCTIGGWTGVLYKIPRADLEKCKNRDHLKQIGVYFLFEQMMKQEGNLFILVKPELEKTDVAY